VVWDWTELMETELLSKSTDTKDEKLDTKTFTDPINLYLKTIAHPSVGNLLSFDDVINCAIATQKQTFFRLANAWVEAGCRDIGEELRIKKVCNEIKMARRFEPEELNEILGTIDQVTGTKLKNLRLEELSELELDYSRCRPSEKELFDRRIGSWHIGIAKLYKKTIDMNRAMPIAITPEIPALHKRRSSSTRVHIKQYECALDEQQLERLLDLRWMYVTPGIIKNLATIKTFLEINPLFCARYMQEKATIMVPRKQKEDIFLIDNIQKVKKSLPTSDTVKCNKWDTFVCQVKIISEVLEIDTPEQLAETICKGAWAQDYLIAHNLKLCVKLAKRFSDRSADFLDTIQEGNVGLMYAIMKFNPGLGHQLSTYETHWMRQAITRSSSKDSRTIRLPIHVTDKISAKKRIVRTLTQNTGKTPTLQEIVEESLRETHEYNLNLVRSIGKELTGKDYSYFETTLSIKEDLVSQFSPEDLERADNPNEEMTKLVFLPAMKRQNLAWGEVRNRVVDKAYREIVLVYRNKLSGVAP
jgi:RNA polymerase sigma factor (sigma-70 family)